MIEFALLWRQWGGGPSEEILIKFGLVSSQYFERLESLLLRINLAPETSEELLRICQHRRTLGGHSSLRGHGPDSPN